MPRFALVASDGDALGTVELGRPDWPDGAIIYRSDEHNLPGGRPAPDRRQRARVRRARRRRDLTAATGELRAGLT